MKTWDIDINVDINLSKSISVTSVNNRASVGTSLQCSGGTHKPELAPLVPQFGKHLLAVHYITATIQACSAGKLRP